MYGLFNEHKFNFKPRSMFCTMWYPKHSSQETCLNLILLWIMDHILLTNFGAEWFNWIFSCSFKGLSATIFNFNTIY
jgi:hypothetical protein